MSANDSLDNLIDVVGLVLFCTSTNRVAIFRRGPGDSGAGHWEFPGGKVEPHESNTTALQREIDEELQFKINPNQLKFIAQRQHHYPTKAIQLFLYLYEVPSENTVFVLSDHDQYRWVSKVDLIQVHFSPADLFLLPEVCKFIGL